MFKRVIGCAILVLAVASISGCSLLSSSLTMPDSLREAIVTNVEYVKAESVALKAEIAAVKAEVQANPNAAELRSIAVEARAQADKAGEAAYDARKAATDTAASAIQQAGSGAASVVTGVATGDPLQIAQGIGTILVAVLGFLGVRKIGTLTNTTIAAEQRKSIRDARYETGTSAADPPTPGGTAAGPSG